ncbi:MAG: hypothetical protein ACO1O6_03365 [Bacteroidota bacterium]
MKALIAILTISTLLAKDIAAFSWDVWFYVNQQEIAREKCENKARPMMHCDGKCYLSKQLKKLEQKEQNHNAKTNPFRNVEKVQVFISTIRFNFDFCPVESIGKPFFGYKDSFSKERKAEVFHPPVMA